MNVKMKRALEDVGIVFAMVAITLAVCLLATYVGQFSELGAWLIFTLFTGVAVCGASYYINN